MFVDILNIIALAASLVGTGTIFYNHWKYNVTSELLPTDKNGMAIIGVGVIFSVTARLIS